VPETVRSEILFYKIMLLTLLHHQQKDRSMQFRFSKMHATAIAAIVFPAALFASPMVQIDTVDAKLGNIYEGQQTSAKHVFKLKNTGDSVLLIQSVKPG
jgi:hypothetical protein